MPSIRLRDGSFTQDPRLDRLVHFDEASRDYPIAAVVPDDIRSKLWPSKVWLDQRREGACVLFSLHGEVAASPVPYSVGFPGPDDASFELIRQRYWEVQRRDPWEGGSYPGATPVYEGTSVLTGAGYMKELGFYDEYRWAFSIEDIMRALSHEGPGVAGIPWLDSMFEPRPSGLLDCSGSTAGGHAILTRGVALRPRLKGEKLFEPVFRLRNSWGESWGLAGDAYIKASDLERLLKDDGEFMVPVGRHKPHA
jgi:hypothetical protein